MGHNTLLRTPKKEEEEEEQQQQEVPENLLVPYLPEINDDFSKKERDIMDELEGILGIEDEDGFAEGKKFCGQFSWDFMKFEGFSIEEEEEEEDEEESDQKVTQMGLYLQESQCFSSTKRKNCGFWDEDHQEKKVCLNLSLNYQQVLDAWSDRGSLFADGYSLSTANNGYMGEVPVMEEDRTRREASVLRYREKRQSRLFSKKIRYQVRKLNADNRPRLKGRFVKRVPEKVPKGC